VDVMMGIGGTPEVRQRRLWVHACVAVVVAVWRCGGVHAMQCAGCAAAFEPRLHFASSTQRTACRTKHQTPSTKHQAPSTKHHAPKRRRQHRQGVIAAAALKCMGGHIQGRLWARDEADAAAIKASGRDCSRILHTDDLVRSNDVRGRGACARARVWLLRGACVPGARCLKPWASVRVLGRPCMRADARAKQQHPTTITPTHPHAGVLCGHGRV
jgi:hypothetical protein